MSRHTHPLSETGIDELFDAGPNTDTPSPAEGVLRMQALGKDTVCLQNPLLTQVFALQKNLVNHMSCG
jgi:hypothetical protein